MASSLDFEQLDMFDIFENVLQKNVENLIIKKFNLSLFSNVSYRAIRYMPVFHLYNGEKCLKYIKIKFCTQENFEIITLDEIEETGGTWREFINHFKSKGCKIVNPKELY